MQDYLNQGLIEACNNGDVHAMKYFISRGADVNCKNHDMRLGNLGPAIENCGRDYEKIKCLVDNGARITRLTLLRSFNSRTAKLTKFLVDNGARIEGDDIFSATSIDICVNNIEVIKYLVETNKLCDIKFITIRKPPYWEDLGHTMRKYRWDDRKSEYRQWRNDIIKLKEEVEEKLKNVVKYIEALG